MEERGDTRIPLQALARKARQQTVEEFSRDFPDPAFTIEPFAPLEDTGFGTMGGGGAGGGALPTVAAIRKRESSNPFMGMITIGRSRNNDVALPYDGVSKFHAYLMKDPATGGYTITDAGSSNGTFVKGRQLEPRTERTPLASGDEVKLGDLKMTFHTNEDLWKALRAEPA